MFRLSRPHSVGAAWEPGRGWMVPTGVDMGTGQGAGRGGRRAIVAALVSVMVGSCSFGASTAGSPTASVPARDPINERWGPGLSDPRRARVGVRCDGGHGELRNRDRKSTRLNSSHL